MTARCKFFNQTRIPVRLTIAKTKTKIIMAHTKTNTLAHTHTGRFVDGTWQGGGNGGSIEGDARSNFSASDEKFERIGKQVFRRIFHALLFMQNGLKILWRREMIRGAEFKRGFEVARRRFSKFMD